MRWVNEILPDLPAACIPALSALRRSSSAATARTRKVVAVGTVRLSVILATSLAAGPLIGLAPDRGEAGRLGGGEVVEDDPELTRLLLPSFPASPLPRALPFFSPTTPLSNRRRHSGPTALGSRRNSSYIAWAKPAFAVSKTLGSTSHILP